MDNNSNRKVISDEKEAIKIAMDYYLNYIKKFPDRKLTLEVKGVTQPKFDDEINCWAVSFILHDEFYEDFEFDDFPTIIVEKNGTVMFFEDYFKYKHGIKD